MRREIDPPFTNGTQKPPGFHVDLMGLEWDYSWDVILELEY